MLQRLFALIFLSACFSIGCIKDNPTTPTSNINLKKGLLAYYAFNGSTIDSSGNDNHGTLLNGGALGYDEHGNFKSALDCNGHVQGMVVNNNGSIKFDTAFTVSMTVMTRDYLPNSFFNLINYNDGTGQAFSIGNDIFTNGKSWTIFVNKKTELCSTSAILEDDDQYFTTKATYQLTESWYHLIVNFSKGRISIYVNGLLDSVYTAPVGELKFCANSQLVIGNYWSEQSVGLNGKIDDVRLYNRTLNAEEIAELSHH